MDHRAVRGIAGERLLHRIVERGAERGPDRRARRVGGDLGQSAGVAGEEADRRSAADHQPVELRARTGGGAGTGGAGKREAAAELLVEARIVAADRDGQQVAFVEIGVDRRKHGRLRAYVEDLVDLVLEALATQRVAIGRVEAKQGVVGARERAADRVVGDGNVEQLGQGVDIVGAARKAPGAVDLERAGVVVAEREGVAGVGIAVADGDDLVDLLGGGRSSGQATERGCGEQREARGGDSKVHEPILPMRPDGRFVDPVNLPAY